MRRRLVAPLVLTALIVVCVSGCHYHVIVHAGPMPHGPLPYGPAEQWR